MQVPFFLGGAGQAECKWHQEMLLGNFPVFCLSGIFELGDHVKRAWPRMDGTQNLKLGCQASRFGCQAQDGNRKSMCLCETMGIATVFQLPSLVISFYSCHNLGTALTCKLSR